jgi:hypothetical protein
LNPTQIMDIYLRFSVHVLLCVGRGLAVDLYIASYYEKTWAKKRYFVQNNKSVLYILNCHLFKHLL